MAFEALACVFFLSLWLCVVWFDLPSIGHLFGLAAIAFGVSVIRDLVATARLMEKKRVEPMGVDSLADLTNPYRVSSIAKTASSDVDLPRTGGSGQN